jgi:hypothetical protein
MKLENKPLKEWVSGAPDKKTRPLPCHDLFNNFEVANGVTAELRCRKNEEHPEPCNPKR